MTIFSTPLKAKPGKIPFSIPQATIDLHDVIKS